MPIYTYILKHALSHTLDSYVYACTSTHPHPINPMCVHMRVYKSTHALTRSLSHTHIHRPTASHAAPSRTSSGACAASGCASSSAFTISSPAPVLSAKCRGMLPFCARADSRQRQHTTHAASQQGGQKAVCSCLLPLCECMLHPSS